MTRRNFSSGAPWESAVGYSRAVRIGNVVEVAGTAAVDEHGKVVAIGDPYGQAKFILKTIGRALAEAGVTYEDVTRTRIFVTDITRWEEVGRAHGEVFGRIRPVTTCVAVSAFVLPELLVEIEATAVAPDRGGAR